MGQVQQTQMSPVAGVKFLAVQQQIGRRRSRVRLGAEVRDVRNALLFVDHQIFDDLANSPPPPAPPDAWAYCDTRLHSSCARARRRSPTGSPHPSADSSGCRRIVRLDFCPAVIVTVFPLEAIFEALHDFDVGAPQAESLRHCPKCESSALRTAARSGRNCHPRASRRHRERKRGHLRRRRKHAPP